MKGVHGDALVSGSGRAGSLLVDHDCPNVQAPERH